MSEEKAPRLRGWAPLRGKRWSEEDLFFLNRNYSSMSIKELAVALSRTEEGILHKAKEEGIKKIPTISPLELTEAEKGYVAGTIDGEGHVGLLLAKKRTWSRHRVRQYTFRVLVPTIGISNTDKRFIISINRVLSRLGYVCICKRRGKKQKVKYQLVLTYAPKVYSVLKEIHQYLIIKKRQSELLLEFCKRRLNPSTRNKPDERDWEIYGSLRELNKRGKR